MRKGSINLPMQPPATGDMSKAVYDPNTVEGDAFDMANMAEATDAKVLTAAERTKLGNLVSNADHTGDVTGATALTIGAKKVTLGMMADGVDGELITYDDSGVAAKIAVGTAAQVLTSNGVGLPPTFQDPGGGGEFQTYEFTQFFMDAPSIANWFGGLYTSISSEFNQNTAVALTSSIATIGSSTLRSTIRMGVAVGNQTVDSLRILASSNITHVGIIKVTWITTGQTIDSIAVLLETTISIPSGEQFKDFTSADFTETSISDKDQLYIFFGSDTTNDVFRCYHRLKCSID